MQRRDNLAASAAELKQQLAGARSEFDAAVEELEKMQALADRDHAAEGHEPRAAHGR